ncbi:cilia- and flagella- associated protein 210 [Pholidichthys leucotaenia]
MSHNTKILLSVDGKRKMSPDEAIEVHQPPDLQQVTVLTKAEWQRIQEELKGMTKDKERAREAAKERETLQLQSNEVAKLWPNTITGQRQKKLDAKNIREQIEEEKRKLADLEDAKHWEERQNKIIEKAKTQLYHQTDRVKGLHSALLLTEVLKEREAQIECQQRIKSTLKDVDKQYVDMMKSREAHALKDGQEKALQRKLERWAVAEDQRKQIKENELVKMQQKLENKKEEQEVQHLQELYQWEQRMKSEREAHQKKNLMQAQLEHITNRDLIRAEEVKKQEAEEEQRKLLLDDKEKMMKLWKDKEKDRIREVQMRQERVLDKLTVTQQDPTVNEELRIAKAVAEQNAKWAREQQEKEKKRVAMLKTITEHRELMKREKENRNRIAEQNMRDTLQEKKEKDKIFLEKQQLKTKKAREEERNVQKFNTGKMAEKSARLQQLRAEEREIEAKKAEGIAEEESRFQQYARELIRAAMGKQQNVFPLCKAAREGIGGGLGPVLNGIRPSYLVHDLSGAQMPRYGSDVTDNMKKLHESVDIQEAKMRLGFTW